VAVNLTVWPPVDGFAELARFVVDVAWFTVNVDAGEELA
jgi:hypothetical protein